jgi:signal transduction histidine kinase
LILLNNSKESFISRNISKREISITVDSNRLEYKDNAGGVQEEFLEKMFQAEFTTKKNSMGLGLYIVKLIAKEKFHTTIKAKNIDKGLCFIMILNQKAA